MALEIVQLAMTSLLGHVCDYVINAHTCLLNVVVGCLIYALYVDGEVKGRQLVVMAAVEELMVYVLWLTVSHGLRSVFALWVCLSICDRIVRPTIHLQQNPYIFVDASVEKTLTQLNIQFDSVSDEKNNAAGSNGTRRINCLGLRMFVFRQFGCWIHQQQQPDCSFKLENISDVSEMGDATVAKRLCALGIESSQCLYMTLDPPDGRRDGLTVVMVTDTKSKRDEWLSAMRQLLSLRAYDVRYAWLLKLCAELAAEPAESQSPSSSHATQITGNPLFASGTITKETTIKVGRNVDLDQAMKILARAGRQADRNYAKGLFKRFASVNEFLMRKLLLTGPDLKQLTWEQFLAFFSCAVNRQEIDDIYDNVLNNSSKRRTLSCSQFYDFITKVQKETVSMTDVEQWIPRYEPVLQNLNVSHIGFANYILDDEQSIFNRAFNRIYQDMSQPLSHYYIATSHNTYLTKDQLTSKSSVDMYISAFKRGCKCVELDVWDGANGEPVICHGYTLTSKILAKDVIQAVKSYAFCTSLYPVILSFENHLSVEQQRVLAQYVICILGDMLYTKPIPNNEKCLPSPEALKGFVLVKMKKLKPDCDESSDDYFFEDELFSMNSDELVDDVIAQQAEKHQRMRQKQRTDSDCGSSISSSISSESDITLDDVSSLKSEGDEDDQCSSLNESNEDRKNKSFDNLVDALENVRKHNKDKDKIKPPKLAQEFSDLVIYCQTTTPREFEVAHQNGKYYEMMSFGEKKALRQAKEDPVYWSQYNHRHLCRVYPGGGRIDSSNLDPVTMWNVGCQLVALNYQTAGPEMQLNQALFTNNGMSGYVLKPDFLRHENPTFDPRSPGDNYDILAIQIISAYQVPYKNEKNLKSERQLTVQVKIVGVESDLQVGRTKPIKNNGLNPLWNEVLFFKIHVPQLAFVVFTVLAKNVFIAHYTIPYVCMTQGYRRVPLLNKSCEPFPYSYLLTHISVQSP